MRPYLTEVSLVRFEFSVNYSKIHKKKSVKVKIVSMAWLLANLGNFILLLQLTSTAVVGKFHLHSCHLPLFEAKMCSHDSSIAIDRIDAQCEL